MLHSLLVGEYSPWSVDVTGWALFLVGIFCLNTIHVLFTFKMLIFMSEFDHLAKAQNRRRSLSFLSECICVFLASYIFFYWISTGRRATELYWAAMALLSFWHTFRQMAGISSLAWYGDKAAAPNLADNSCDRCIRIEKLNFMALYLIFALHTIALLFTRSLPPDWLHVISWAAGVSSFLCVCWIFWGSLEAGYPLMHWKILYLFRLFYFPFVYFSLPAAVAITAMHGIEYLYIYREMNRRSEVRSHKWEDYFLPMAIPITIGILLTMPYGSGLSWWLWGPGANERLPVISWIASVGGALTLTHYYLDWKIFRFREVSQRTYVAPLLNSFMNTNLTSSKPPASQ